MLHRSRQFVCSAKSHLTRPGEHNQKIMGQKNGKPLPPTSETPKSTGRASASSNSPPLSEQKSYRTKVSVSPDGTSSNGPSAKGGRGRPPPPALSQIAGIHEQQEARGIQSPSRAWSGGLGGPGVSGARRVGPLPGLAHASRGGGVAAEDGDEDAALRRHVHRDGTGRSGELARAGVAAAAVHGGQGRWRSG